MQNKFLTGEQTSTNKIHSSQCVVQLQRLQSKTFTTTQANAYCLGTHFLVEQSHQIVNRQHAILTDGCEDLSQTTMNEHQICVLRAGDPIKNAPTAVFPKVVNPGWKAPATLTPSPARLSFLKPLEVEVVFCLSQQMSHEKYSVSTGLCACVFVFKAVFSL